MSCTYFSDEKNQPLRKVIFMYHTQLLLKLLPNDFLMCHTQLLFNSEFKKMPIHLIYRNLFIELERRNRDDNKLENIMGKKSHLQQQHEM